MLMVALSSLPPGLMTEVALSSGQMDHTTFFPGQIGMRPPLHCASTFSTCLWFTNFTRIPGSIPSDMVHFDSCIISFFFKVLQLLTLSFGLTASSFTTKQVML